MQELCMICEKPLTKDEISMHKKLINRGAKEYMCLHCLSKHFNVDETLLIDKIEFFKEQGCTLFSRN